MWGTQVIALCPGVAQEFIRGHSADYMRSMVMVHCATVAVPEIPRHFARFRAAGLWQTRETRIFSQMKSNDRLGASSVRMSSIGSDHWRRSTFFQSDAKDISDPVDL